MAKDDDRAWLAAREAEGFRDPESQAIPGTATAAPSSSPKARGVLEVQEATRGGKRPARRAPKQAAMFTGEELGEAQRDLFGRKRNPRIETVQRAGLDLVAKRSKYTGQLQAAGYANRTQATRKAAQLGAPWRMIDVPTWRPWFFVGRDHDPAAAALETRTAPNPKGKKMAKRSKRRTGWIVNLYREGSFAGSHGPYASRAVAIRHAKALTKRPPGQAAVLGSGRPVYVAGGSLINPTGVPFSADDRMSKSGEFLGPGAYRPVTAAGGRKRVPLEPWMQEAAEAHLEEIPHVKQNPDEWRDKAKFAKRNPRGFGAAFVAKAREEAKHARDAAAQHQGEARRDIEAAARTFEDAAQLVASLDAAPPPRAQRQAMTTAITQYQDAARTMGHVYGRAFAAKRNPSRAKLTAAARASLARYQAHLARPEGLPAARREFARAQRLAAAAKRRNPKRDRYVIFERAPHAGGTTEAYVGGYDLSLTNQPRWHWTMDRAKADRFSRRAALAAAKVVEKAASDYYRDRGTPKRVRLAVQPETGGMDVERTNPYAVEGRFEGRRVHQTATTKPHAKKIAKLLRGGGVKRVRTHYTKKNPPPVGMTSAPVQHARKTFVVVYGPSGPEVYRVERGGLQMFAGMLSAVPSPLWEKLDRAYAAAVAKSSEEAWARRTQGPERKHNPTERDWIKAGMRAEKVWRRFQASGRKEPTTTEVRALARARRIAKIEKRHARTAKKNPPRRRLSLKEIARLPGVAKVLREAQRQANRTGRAVRVKLTR